MLVHLFTCLLFFMKLTRKSSRLERTGQIHYRGVGIYPVQGTDMTADEEHYAASLSSGYKSPDNEISGYLSMICFARPFDTSLCPDLILLINEREQPFKSFVTASGPPAIFINLSNSLFINRMIRYVSLQMQAFLLRLVSLLKSNSFYNFSVELIIKTSRL